MSPMLLRHQCVYNRDTCTIEGHCYLVHSHGDLWVVLIILKHFTNYANCATGVDFSYNKTDFMECVTKCFYPWTILRTKKIFKNWRWVGQKCHTLFFLIRMKKFTHSIHGKWNWLHNVLSGEFSSCFNLISGILTVAKYLQLEENCTLIHEIRVFSFIF